MSELRTTIPEMLDGILLTDVEHLRFYVVGKVCERPQLRKAMEHDAVAASINYEPDGINGPSYGFALEPIDDYIEKKPTPEEGVVEPEEPTRKPVASLTIIDSEHPESRISLFSDGLLTYMACGNDGFMKEAGEPSNERAAELLAQLTTQLGPVRPLENRGQM